MAEKKVRPLLQRYRSVFMRRSYAAFKNMQHRFGKNSICFEVLPLRSLISEALKVGICPLCKDRLTPKNFSVDHMIPASRGGSLDIINLEIVCLSCNRAKGPLNRDEFLALVETLRPMGDFVMKSVLGRLKAGGAITSGRNRFRGVS